MRGRAGVRTALGVTGLALAAVLLPVPGAARTAQVTTEFPPCPTATLDASVTPGNELLTVDWDAVGDVSEYEIGWHPPATDGRRVTAVRDLTYTIDSLQNDVKYLITLGAGPDHACVVNGTPVGNDVEQEPVPAIPFAGLVALALALTGGGVLRRRRPTGTLEPPATSAGRR